MTAATMTLASSSSSAINQGAASPSVGDGSTPPVSGLAEGSGSELAEGSGEPVTLGAGVGEAVELGGGVGVAVGAGVAVGVEPPGGTTATPLQVEPQPVAVEDRVTKVRPLLASNTPKPAVGAFPKKVTEVRRLP
jgi:hypothetical protein